ncbi:hypothetical protein CRG98_003356 [Punica granatum]|uniref:Uncharacterized protein n=1 Tax=Punica granatum TaxID=22663 RepID=A0A2I0L6A2_PUNGR|nr:hypothetical protein CRG98_003356 [Punica granatum]
MLAEVSEETTLQVLERISDTRIKHTLDGFIFSMVRKVRSTGWSASPSPHMSSSEWYSGVSPATKQALNFNVQCSEYYIERSFLNIGAFQQRPVVSVTPRHFLCLDDGSASTPIGEGGENSLVGSENRSGQRISHTEALIELGFRKASLPLRYTGEWKHGRKKKLSVLVKVKEMQSPSYQLWRQVEMRKMRVDMAAMKRDAEHSRQEHMKLEKRYRELTDLLYHKQAQLEATAGEKRLQEVQDRADNFSAREVAESMGLATPNLP